MAKCNLCEREMLEANGCMDKDYKIDGKLMQAVRHVARDYTKYGIEIEEEDFRCHDCGCKIGEFHHTGCDMEQCPKCGGQFIFCDCDISDEVILYPRGRERGQIHQDH